MELPLLLATSSVLFRRTSLGKRGGRAAGREGRAHLLPRGCPLGHLLDVLRSLSLSFCSCELCGSLETCFCGNALPTTSDRSGEFYVCFVWAWTLVSACCFVRMTGSLTQYISMVPFSCQVYVCLTSRSVGSSG